MLGRAVAYILRLGFNTLQDRLRVGSPFSRCDNYSLRLGALAAGVKSPDAVITDIFSSPDKNQSRS